MSVEGHPVMGFIVQMSHQKNQDAIRTRKIEGKVSMRILQNADVDFFEAWCPDVNVMGDHGTRKRDQFLWKLNFRTLSVTNNIIVQLDLHNLWDEYWKHLVSLLLGFRLEFVRVR